MKILLLGKNGQLGYEAHRTLIHLGDVIALDYPEINFAKPSEVIKSVEEINPDLIYNAVAYTNVDRAEDETQKARLINSETPGELGRYCHEHKIPIIHFSTDYVFDGRKNALYNENDIPNPINVYGETKLAGEINIIQSNCDFLIFRTSWVYSMRSGGFVRKVIDWARINEELKVVDDQIGNPTWARTLAFLSSLFLQNNKSFIHSFFEENKGIYHLAGGGFTSRYEWTKSIIENISSNFPVRVKKILPAKTVDFPTPAHRPLFSALDCSKFEEVFKENIPEWELALDLAMSSLRRTD